MRLNPAAQALLGTQRGILADWQAQRVGITPRQLRYAMSTGSWRLVTPHVFASQPVEPTAVTRRRVGLLEAGPQAVLGGRAALAESGWRDDGSNRDDGSDPVDVFLPRGSRWRSRSSVPWLRLHLPLELPESIGHPPRTRPARSAVDGAAWSRTARGALLVILGTAQQRLVSVEAMRREVESRSRLRHADAIRDALAELAGGATCISESDFLRECRRHGLPAPVMQTRHVLRGGVRWTDAQFRLPDGRTLLVEIDGVGHMTASGWHSDIARHNELAIGSGADLQLRVTGWELRHDPDAFFALIAPLFAAAA